MYVSPKLNYLSTISSFFYGLIILFRLLLLSQAVNVPRDSASVEYAKHRHHELYEQIAREHERIGAEQYQLRLAFEATSEIPIEI